MNIGDRPVVVKEEFVNTILNLLVHQVSQKNNSAREVLLRFFKEGIKPPKVVDKGESED